MGRRTGQRQGGWDPGGFEEHKKTDCEREGEGGSPGMQECMPHCCSARVSNSPQLLCEGGPPQSDVVAGALHAGA